MQKSEVGDSGATGAAELTSLPALTGNYKQPVPEINKRLQGYVNLRLRRETLMK